MPKILCFTPLPTHPQVTFYTIDDGTFETKQKICAIDKNADLPRKNIKAVIFRFIKGEQKESAKMAQMLEDYYSKYKIPFFCCSWNSIYLSATLLAVVDEYGDDEKLDDEMDLIFCEDGCFGYYKIIKDNNNQYRINLCNLNRLPNDQLGSLFKKIDSFENAFISCPSPSPETPFEEETEEDSEISSFFNRATSLPQVPKHSTPQEIQQLIIEVLEKNNKKITVINKDIKNYLSKAIALKADHLLRGERTDSKYYDVANTAIKSYSLSTTNMFFKRLKLSSANKNKMNNFIIKILISDIVPIQKTVVYYKELKDIVLIGPDDDKSSSIRAQHYDAGTTIKFSIDKHFLFHPYIKKDNIFSKNAVFICLKGTTFSVDLVRKGVLEKKVLEKIPIAVSFVDGNVQIGEKAIKMQQNFNSFVITDLIKIMSFTNLTEFEIDPTWGFTVTDDSDDDKILLEFDTFRGRRKATPAFLFAFILKWTIKNVEKILGDMPDTVVIVAKEMNENLKKQLKVSFENSKLDISDFQIQYHKIIEIQE